MREIHEGICGNHSGARMLAQKATQAGYYWPLMSKDAARVVKYCDKCQKFSRFENSHPEKFTGITSPWPFAKWGVDIVRPMPPGKGSKKILVMAVDYFTKWAEAEAMAVITATNVISFLWRSVVCRFGIPDAFVTDNGTQFDSQQFQKWCSELRIRNYYSSVLRPKANGQVEATNKTLMRTLKKKLKTKKGAWVEYIPEVLWSYRTTARTPTGETPFSLNYGTKAVIPAEVGSPSFRVAYYNPGDYQPDFLPKKLDRVLEEYPGDYPPDFLPKKLGRVLEEYPRDYPPDFLPKKLSRVLEEYPRDYLPDSLPKITRPSMGGYPGYLTKHLSQKVVA
jgi:hypothetical protein